MQVTRGSMQERYERAIIAAFRNRTTIFTEDLRSLTIFAVIDGRRQASIELKPLYRDYIDMEAMAD